MKTQKTILMRLKILILILALGGCSKDDPGGENPGPISGNKAEEFNALMASLPEFNQPDEIADPQVTAEDPLERDTDDSSLECFTTYYKHAPGFNDMLALDPTTDVIFPGAILKGESIPTGEYIPIVADRAKITLSASLTNISGSPVVEITDPKLSTVREGVKSILDQEVTGATPAQVNFEISQVYTKEQLNLAIGANYRSAATKVSASFDFEKSTYKYKYVMKYFQVYYTIDMDPPQNPSDLFLSTPDLGALGSTSPVYVATVTYGRMIIYTIESSYSRTEIDAAFSASFGSNDGSIEAEYEKVINESSIKALVVGGSGGDAAQVVNGPADVYNYISEGGNYSRESPGAPLSYKLRYLKQGTPVARVVLSSEYAVRECDVAYPQYSITLLRLRCTGCQDGDGSAAELTGTVRTQLYVDQAVVGSKILWSANSSNPYSLAKNATNNIGTSYIKELNKPDYDTDYIRLYGSMLELDLWPDADDDFGSPNLNVPLKDIPMDDVGINRTLSFKGVVGADYNIRRIK